MAYLRVRVPDAHAWHGLAGLGAVWHGQARLGGARQGMARYGSAWQVMAWLGPDGLGMERQGRGAWQC